MKIILFLSFLFVSVSSFGQNCDCMQEYKWAKKVFEENDAGYSYYIQKYGKQAIEFNNKKWEKEFVKSKEAFHCLSLLNNWLHFYRKGHLNISMEDQTKIPPANSNTAESPLPEKSISINIPAFKEYAAALKQGTFEGIWSNGMYEVGVKEIKSEYIGFIINSKNENWKQGEIKFRFPVERKAHKKSTYYMGDHKPLVKIFDPCELIGNSYLKAFDIYWNKISPTVSSDQMMDMEVSSLSALMPYILKINEHTTLMRIPSFDNGFIMAVDSIVKANQELLIKSEYLIIDIRGNGGGADRCYQAITPYLYTNPIKTMWVDFYSTPLNNARYDWIAKLDGFSENEKQGFRDMQKKLDSNIGGFVNLNENGMTFVVDTLPNIFETPKKIAVLINNANASTAEQFILMAKQSQKVKLFGKRTFGALDFSNLNYVTSPGKIFKLNYTTSRSFRIPDMAIDDYGIQPDFYFDNSIPEHEWIRNTLKILDLK